MDSESIKKMLRSVLQSSKTGISINNLQSEYRSLCGESIPLKHLGFLKLEDYLRSIPSVVRLEYHMSELKCFAAVCEETAHIAELVAKQKSSKKSGRSQVVNCKMRFKTSNPYMLNVRPRSSLRQPSSGDALNLLANLSRSHGGNRGSATGDYRQFDQSLSSITPMEHRQPATKTAVKPCVTPQRKEKSSVNLQNAKEKPPDKTSRPNQSQSSVYDVELVQARLTQLLEKCSSGLWISKVSGVYSQMFNEKLYPQVLIDLEKWTHICMVEHPSSTNRVDRLIYPPLPCNSSGVLRSSTNKSPPTSSTDSSITTTVASPEQSSYPFAPSAEPQPRFSPKNPLAKPTFIYSQQAVASSVKPLSLIKTSFTDNPALAPQLCPPCVNRPVHAIGGCKDKNNLSTGTINPNQHNRPSASTQTCPISVHTPVIGSCPELGPDILPLLKVTFCTTSDCAPSSKSPVVSADVRHRIKELLSKYSHGLWAHALPKLFMDTYKTPFPEHLLENVSLYLDIWTVEYPIPHDKNKAILYNASRMDMETTDMETTDSEESQQCKGHPLPSGIPVLGSVVPPCLALPLEQYPSVLITDAKSSNAVTIRYVGENYSKAQEAMEDKMRSFYSQSSTCHSLPNPVVGQLVAVRGEDGDELSRAQVVEVMAPDMIKVYYVDHGFSVETNGTNLLELHQDFLFLPYQAINVRLAGLEAFSSHPLVLSCLDQLAIGKILLMETLEPREQNETPVAVLYDTSQDVDININSACLKALQDENMNNPLTINTTYQDVCVTNVCPDGIIYCQLPSRGTARLSKLLEKTEAFFIAQMTSESLVSRPFCGKFCLAQYKGKWLRVEIKNLHGNGVMEILFIDLGVPATVEVTDLREIPPLLLQDFTVIPRQAIRCRLANVIPEGDWSPDVFQWVKEAVEGSKDCKMKIIKLDEHKGSCLVYMYLFVGADGQELNKGINYKLATKKNITNITNNSSEDTALGARAETLTLASSVPNAIVRASAQPHHGATHNEIMPLPLPPPLELPQPGQNMDVFVTVACHPGYFVLQPWQDQHKLVVLMGEMILYYNRMWKDNSTMRIRKGEIYAAKIDKNWHRVQVKGVLANGLVSVYELDHGKHEVVRSTLIRPLIEEFRQLPFQAITAQLAGVEQHSWSEEACMLFRNHVENRALVAQVETVQELLEHRSEMWECRLTVYLVDTTLEDRDLWIHSIMADIGGELSSAA